MHYFTTLANIMEQSSFFRNSKAISKEVTGKIILIYGNKDKDLYKLSNKDFNKCLDRYGNVINRNDKYHFVRPCGYITQDRKYYDLPKMKLQSLNKCKEYAIDDLKNKGMKEEDFSLIAFTPSGY